MIRVLVTGGRNFRDYRFVDGIFRRITNKYGPTNLTLICGMAAGADSLAWQCANSMEWKEIEEYPAKWDELGRRAGIVRNLEMLAASPSFCVAFPGGRGTHHMVTSCYNAGVTVYRFNPQC